MALERATMLAVDAAEWITPADLAAVQHQRDLAQFWDRGYRGQTTLDGSPSLPPRELIELAGRLQYGFRELGLTPAARHRMGLGDDTDDAFAHVLSIARTKGGDPTD